MRNGINDVSHISMAATISPTTLDLTSVITLTMSFIAKIANPFLFLMFANTDFSSEQVISSQDISPAFLPSLEDLSASQGSVLLSL